MLGYDLFLPFTMVPAFDSATRGSSSLGYLALGRVHHSYFQTYLLNFCRHLGKQKRAEEVSESIYYNAAENRVGV